MKKLAVCLVLALLALSCKSKKKKPESTYFSVLNYLQAQVHALDTANYSFTRIQTVNGLSDTVPVPKSAVRGYAADFLALPDIASPDLKDSYDEANTYEESLNNVLLTYSANTPDVPVRSETVMLEPDEAGNTKPATILVKRIDQSDDSTVVKDLTWHVNKRFQVVTKTSRKGQPEIIRTLTLKWE